MHVRDGMSSMVLTVGPQHTLREAARLMSKRSVGAANYREIPVAEDIHALREHPGAAPLLTEFHIADG